MGNCGCRHRYDDSERATLLKQAERAKMLNRVAKNPWLIYTAPPEWKRDHEVMMSAVSRCGLTIRSIDMQLPSSRSLENRRLGFSVFEIIFCCMLKGWLWLFVQHLSGEL